MIRDNRKRRHEISKGWQIRAALLIVAILFTVTAGCSGKLSEEVRKPVEGVTEKVTSKPTGETTPEPTEGIAPTGASEPTEGTEPTGTLEATKVSELTSPLSVTGGRVTFTGTTAEVSEAQPGDTVRFGSYEQDNDESNGTEAIEWLVLDEQDGKLLLLSKYELDAKPYNTENENVTWETCTLRDWLNSTFYTTAFSTAEQERIATTRVRNEANPKYGMNGGNDTEDKVFLLSTGEATRYFDPDPDVYDPVRCAKVTAYARAQGGFVYKAEYGWYGTTEYDGNGYWWLRSPGAFDNRAALVCEDGKLYLYGRSAGLGDGGVRPAFWLDPEA